MMNANLQLAIDNLEIRDVYVRDQIASCKGDFDPKVLTAFDNLNAQQAHLVTRSSIIELEGGELFTRVHIRLGIRWVDPKQELDELAVRALIEAEFIAEYAMKKMINQNCIDEFALKNASYHVWPYWRELLSNQCLRMQFPKIILPAVQLAYNRHADQSDVVTTTTVRKKIRSKVGKKKSPIK